MTKNQIEYGKLRETQRANLSQEDLTRKRDTAAKELGINTLAETSRHNKAVEILDSSKLAETVRSNVAKEQETRRHNEAGELLGSKQLDETIRHQTATEGETQRHNKVGEAVDIGRAATYATSEAAKAVVDSAKTAETARHNMVVENETWRHNLADESIRAQQKEPQITVHSTVDARSSTPVQVVVPTSAATEQVQTPLPKTQTQIIQPTTLVPSHERSLLDRFRHLIVYGDDPGRSGEHYGR